jgi:hypothetical protein
MFLNEYDIIDKPIDFDKKFNIDGIDATNEIDMRTKKTHILPSDYSSNDVNIGCQDSEEYDPFSQVNVTLSNDDPIQMNPMETEGNLDDYTSSEHRKSNLIKEDTFFLKESYSLLSSK